MSYRGNARRVHDALRLEHPDAGDHVAIRPGAGIAVDRMLVRVAEIVAAAVVGLEYQKPAGREQVAQGPDLIGVEPLGRGGFGAPVTEDDQRIARAGLVAVRVGQYA